MTNNKENDELQRHRAFVAKYVTYEAPAEMPCLIATWSDSMDVAIGKAIAVGCKVQRTDKPMDGIELVGSKTRFLLRDYSIAKQKAPHKKLGLYEQFCIFEHVNAKQANLFLDVLIAAICSRQITIDGLYESESGLVRNYTCRTENRFRLYCVTVITKRHDFNNPDAVDLYLHWRIDYLAKSAWESNRKAADSNLPDSTTVA